MEFLSHKKALEVSLRASGYFRNNCAVSSRTETLCDKMMLGEGYISYHYFSTLCLENTRCGASGYMCYDYQDFFMSYHALTS